MSKWGRKRIVVDVDTQRDFLLADGLYCVTNHRRVLMHIRRIMAWVRMNNIKVISTCRILSDKSDAGGKISYTSLGDSCTFYATDNTDLLRNILHYYQQIVFQKRCANPFNEPLLDRMLTDVRVTDFIIIGANFDNAFSLTVQGLLLRGKKVTIVTDAFGAYDNKKRETEFRKAEIRGAKLIETKDFAGTSHLKQIGACGCSLCKGFRRPTIHCLV